MKKVLVGVLVGLGLVGLGIAMSFVKESKEVEGISTVPCQEVGFVYEETMPEHLPVCCVEELEEMVFEMYLEECTNYCAECDLYYYDDCVCWNKECGSDCEYCLEFDFMMYIEDNYDMIQELADEMLIGIQEDYMDRETELVIYEF